MYNQLENENSKKMLEVEIFVTQFFEGEGYEHLPRNERKGKSIPLNQISDRVQMNTRFKDAFDEDLGEYNNDYTEIYGSIELFINGKHILNATHERSDLLSLWLGLNLVTVANLRLISILAGDKADEDIVVNYYEHEQCIHPFTCSWMIPKNDKNTLIFSYKSPLGKGEEHLDRNKFSQLFLVESKHFLEKILTLFHEVLAVKEEHFFKPFLPCLEEVNFVRGFLLCEELNRNQKP